MLYNHPNPTLHVVVHVEEPYVVYNKSIAKYEGFVYNIWQGVKTALQNQYSIEDTYADTDDFSGVLQTYVRDRGYDIAIGAFSVFPERLSYCAFSVPYVLDKHVLLTSNEINWVNTLSVIVKQYLPASLFIVMLGFLFAHLFRAFDIKNKATNPKKTFLNINFEECQKRCLQAKTFNCTSLDHSKSKCRLFDKR